jgi:hypothetical protein
MLKPEAAEAAEAVVLAAVVPVVLAAEQDQAQVQALEAVLVQVIVQVAVPTEIQVEAAGLQAVVTLAPLIPHHQIQVKEYPD